MPGRQAGGQGGGQAGKQAGGGLGDRADGEGWGCSGPVLAARGGYAGAVTMAIACASTAARGGDLHVTDRADRKRGRECCSIIRNTAK